MEYKVLRILVIISMIFGVIMFSVFLGLMAGDYQGYYARSDVLLIIIFYSCALFSLFAFDVCPLLYLRKKNKQQQKVI
ncbi:MAG: hypothetical protein ACFE9I_06055 [Candidatus Hermodarchaeota archaeon]